MRPPSDRGPGDSSRLVGDGGCDRMRGPSDRGHGDSSRLVDDGGGDRMRPPSYRAPGDSARLVDDGDGSWVVVWAASDRSPGDSARLVGDGDGARGSGLQEALEAGDIILSEESVESSPVINLAELYTSCRNYCTNTGVKHFLGQTKKSSRPTEEDPKQHGPTRVTTEEDDPNQHGPKEEHGPTWVKTVDPFLSVPTPGPVKVPPSRYPRPLGPPLPPPAPSPPIFWRISFVPPADVSNYVGWVIAPDPGILSSRNRHSICYVSDDDKPGALVGKPWRCPGCKVTYSASYNLFANIPAPKCPKCIPTIENCSAYNWTITRVIVDWVHLDFPRIYMQETILCTVYAFMAMCDLMRKIRGVDRGWIEPLNLCIDGISAVYKSVHGYAIGEEPAGVGRIENILVAVCCKGVPFQETKFRQRQPNKESLHSSLKVRCWFRIPVDEVDKIIRIIANGIPLMGILPLGNLFKYVKAKQVYHAPELGKHTDLHAVVLHGSAYAAPEGKFYKCRNSWGNMAHGDYMKRDQGADFEARCSDFVHYVYGFELA